MRKYDAGVGEKSAPIARVMATLTQVDDQIDRMGAARAEEQGRPIGRDARSIRGEEKIGFEQTVLVGFTELSEPDGADLLAHLDQQLDVEAKPATFGHDRGECGHIDRVLALIVGGAPSVNAVTPNGDRPGREALAPELVE